MGGQAQPLAVVSAIDNATRKLMTQGARPVTVGFWFALGHSTVVAAACALIGFFTVGVKDHLEDFKGIGGLIGTFVSSSFLLLIGVFNLLVFLGVLKAYRAARDTGRYHEQDVDALMAKHGFLARVLRPLFALIAKSWHMYPLGFLFGLGFDTATAIGLFSMTAATASEGVSLSTVMVFPALFTTGMALADATDGALMLGAYEWAYVKPVRKLFYNLTITAMSAFVALVIGMLQALGLIAECVGEMGDQCRQLDAATRRVFEAVLEVGAGCDERPTLVGGPVHPGHQRVPPGRLAVLVG